MYPNHLDTVVQCQELDRRLRLAQAEHEHRLDPSVPRIRLRTRLKQFVLSTVHQQPVPALRTPFARVRKPLSAFVSWF